MLVFSVLLLGTSALAAVIPTSNYHVPSTDIEVPVTTYKPEIDGKNVDPNVQYPQDEDTVPEHVPVGHQPVHQYPIVAGRRVQHPHDEHVVAERQPVHYPAQHTDFVGRTVASHHHDEHVVSEHQAVQDPVRRTDFVGRNVASYPHDEHVIPERQPVHEPVRRTGFASRTVASHPVESPVQQPYKENFIFNHQPKHVDQAPVQPVVAGRNVAKHPVVSPAQHPYKENFFFNHQLKHVDHALVEPVQHPQPFEHHGGPTVGVHHPQVPVVHYQSRHGVVDHVEPVENVDEHFDQVDEEGVNVVPKSHVTPVVHHQVGVVPKSHVVDHGVVHNQLPVDAVFQNPILKSVDDQGVVTVVSNGHVVDQGVVHHQHPVGVVPKSHVLDQGVVHHQHPVSVVPKSHVVNHGVVHHQHSVDAGFQNPIVKPVDVQARHHAARYEQDEGVVDVVPRHHIPSHVTHQEVVDDHSRASARILQQEMELYPDGSFFNVWDSENGIKVAEQGTIKHVGDKDVAVQNGEISYVDDEGKTFHIRYVADENGFHVEGDHLPTPPPIPAAIARALEYSAAHPWVETTTVPHEQYPEQYQEQYSGPQPAVVDN